ncbi:hypothetical protein EG327_001616 [Venturia inaequalis]|uniref:Uncharacterized protein n=1 Tax=Venturia inaequalis TaxID=5025 RepID=A0A8H3VJH9_VENIN|nr:hypothetical protein EG327_001616 [Venturia inaequalis]
MLVADYGDMETSDESLHESESSDVVGAVEGENVLKTSWVSRSGTAGLWSVPSQFIPIATSSTTHMPVWIMKTEALIMCCPFLETGSASSSKRESSLVGI